MGGHLGTYVRLMFVAAEYIGERIGPLVWKCPSWRKMGFERRSAVLWISYRYRSGGRSGEAEVYRERPSLKIEHCWKPGGVWSLQRSSPDGELCPQLAFHSAAIVEPERVCAEAVLALVGPPCRPWLVSSALRPRELLVPSLETSHQGLTSVG